MKRARSKVLVPASPYGPASHRHPLARRIASAGAAILLGIMGATLPGASTALAETAATPILVPATLQSSAIEAAMTPRSVVETPGDEADAEEPASTAAAATRIGSGVASWYGKEFKGRRTASGETFDPAELTAAHRTLPFGSKVLVTNPRNGQSVVVRINDRGPFKHSRVIDVSRAAAVELGLIGPGSGQVTLDLIEE